MNSINYTAIQPTNGLEAFKESRINIEGERFRVLKGIVKVKIDRSQHNSEFIDIPVHIIKSYNSSPREPIFWLAGGPGVSNLKQKPSKQLLANHDFVLVGYRGVDGEVKLNSRKLQQAVKGINNALLSNESITNIQNVIELYSKELKEKGVDLSNFTIIDVIDDIEDVRNQLGYKKINLLSTSYGTRVALLYSYRYPKAISRSVMVGVNPPGHFVWWPNKTEEIIQAYDLLYQQTAHVKAVSIKESIQTAFRTLALR